MALNEQQYRRIASWLDGEPVALSPEERAVGEEIRRAEWRIRGLMDVGVRPEAIDRVRRRVAAELTRRRRRVLRISYVSAAGVAAAIILAIAVFQPGPAGSPTAPATAAPTPYVVPEPTACDMEIELLAGDIDELTSEVLFSEFSIGLDTSFDVIEEEIQELWLSESLTEEYPQYEEVL